MSIEIAEAPPDIAEAISARHACREILDEIAMIESKGASPPDSIWRRLCMANRLADEAHAKLTPWGQSVYSGWVFRMES